MRVYIAAPYTLPDPVVNTRNVILIGDRLREAGLVPYIPHLTMFWHMLCPHDVDYWYEYDLEWLRACDVLLRLPGESHGADNEVYEALSLGMIVFYSLDNLLSWWKGVHPVIEKAQ